jgi:hypothetical protein
MSYEDAGDADQEQAVYIARTTSSENIGDAQSDAEYGALLASTDAIELLYRKRKAERKIQEPTTIRETVYRKLFKIESDKATRDEKKDAFESQRLESEQHRIAMEREEKLLDHQARASDRAIEQEKQSEGINTVLKHMTDTQKAMQEGFLNVLERILDKIWRL